MIEQHGHISSSTCNFNFPPLRSSSMEVVLKPSNETTRSFTSGMEYSNQESASDDSSSVRRRLPRNRRCCSLADCVDKSVCVHCTCNGDCELGHADRLCGNRRVGNGDRCQVEGCSKDDSCLHSLRAICYICRSTITRLNRQQSKQDKEKTKEGGGKEMLRELNQQHPRTVVVVDKTAERRCGTGVESLRKRTVPVPIAPIPGFNHKNADSGQETTSHLQVARRVTHVPLSKIKEDRQRGFAHNGVVYTQHEQPPRQQRIQIRPAHFDHPAHDNDAHHYNINSEYRSQDRNVYRPRIIREHMHIERPIYDHHRSLEAQDSGPGPAPEPEPSTSPMYRPRVTPMEYERRPNRPYYRLPAPSRRDDRSHYSHDSRPDHDSRAMYGEFVHSKRDGREYREEQVHTTATYEQSRYLAPHSENRMYENAPYPSASHRYTNSNNRGHSSPNSLVYPRYSLRRDEMDYSVRQVAPISHLQHSRNAAPRYRLGVSSAPDNTAAHGRNGATSNSRPHPFPHYLPRSSFHQSSAEKSRESFLHSEDGARSESVRLRRPLLVDESMLDGKRRRLESATYHMGAPIKSPVSEQSTGVTLLPRDVSTSVPRLSIPARVSLVSSRDNQPPIQQTVLRRLPAIETQR